MRAVNLLPHDRPGSRHASTPASRLALVVREPLLIVAVAATLVAAAGIVVVERSASSTIAARQATLRDLNAQIAKLPKTQPTTTRPQAGGVTQRLSDVRSVAQHRMPWDGFLSALSRVLPEDVWLLNLSAGSQSTAAPVSSGSPVPSSASSPAGFTITGYTYSQPSVARLMRRLTLIPWLRDVSLTTSSKMALASHTVFQFTLGANVVSLPEVGS